MKKILCMVLALVMMLSLAACSQGSTAEKPNDTQEEADAAQVAEDTAEVVEEIASDGEWVPVDKDGNKPTLGYCCWALEAEFFQTCSHYLEVACEKYGFDYVVQSGDMLDPTSQCDIIENFVTMGVDVIVINPIVADALTDSIRQATEAGVIVIGQLFLPTDEASQYCTFTVAGDQYQDGRDISAMALRFARELHADEDIKVAIFGTKTGESNIRRVDGMRQGVIETLGEDAILSEVYPTSADEAMGAAEDCQVVNDGEINTWICFNDQHALGVYQYYVSNGLDQSDIVIVGRDGDVELLELIVKNDTGVKATFGTTYLDTYDKIVLAGRMYMEGGYTEEARAEVQEFCDNIVLASEVNHDNVDSYMAESNWRNG